jgi:transketolase
MVRMTTALSYSQLPGLMTRMTGDEKYGPSATSTLDVLWVLYQDILRVDSADSDDPDRDRFLLSKGHGPMAYYAVLAAHGFLTAEDLDGPGRSTLRSGSIPTARWCPEWRSAPVRWVTVWASRWAPRSGFG